MTSKRAVYRKPAEYGTRELMDAATRVISFKRAKPQLSTITIMKEARRYRADF